MDNRIRDIEENIKDKQIMNACKAVGSLKAGFQPHTDLSKSTNNELLSKKEDIKNRWETYFQELLYLPASAVQSSPSKTIYRDHADTEEELEEEPPDIPDIETAITSMHNNKSPGIDNIPAEF